ncbi:MAG TPA: VOC family protein, partial [Terriglobia bacterium]|nr:VOC family protein [Terriglobia bacterium]
MRRWIVMTSLCVLAVVMVALATEGRQRAAVSPAFPAGDVVLGSGSFSPIVSDLEKSLAFYNDLFGLPAPASTPQFSNSDSGLLNFLGVPTAQTRVATARIPGTNPAMNVELVDFKDIERRAARPRPQDPGATRLILLVRDVDALLTRLKTKGVPVVTTGGAPVDVTMYGGEKGRAVIVSDPDGFAIELLQLDPLPQGAATGDILGARVGLTVASMDQTLKVYGDLLKFGVSPVSQFQTDSAWNRLAGVPTGETRKVSARVPGSPLLIEFVEFRGVERRPIGARIQDPGATRLQLRARDADAAIAALKAAGGTVVTTGGDGGPITMRGLRLGIV